MNASCRVVSIALATLILSGCGKDQSGSGVSDSDLPPPEATWHVQIAAVREGRSDAIRVADSQVSASQFRELADGCESLKTLVLDRTAIDNEDLSALSHLPKLRWLKLPVSLDDRGLEALVGCRDLEILNLPNGVFTDQACNVFADLEELTLLRFGSPKVTDQGIAALVRLPRLRFLHLLDVPITDAGLRSIASMTSLESFYLDGGQVTDAALERLLSKRPDLHFHRNQRHLPGDPNAHGDETAH